MGMTMTEKILAAHAGLDKVVPREFISVDLDLVMSSDATFPVSLKAFKRAGYKSVTNPDKIVLVMDHFTPCKDIISAENCRACREFARDMGVDEAIKRVNEYHKAGTDFVLIDAPGDEDELKKIADNIRAPIMVNMVEGGKTPILPKQTLEDMGFSLICYPTFVLFAAVKCLREMLAALKETGDSNKVKDRLESFKSYTDLVGLPQLQELEKKYVL